MRWNKRWAPAAAALLIGVVSTILVAVIVAAAERGRSHVQFERVADAATNAVDTRLLSQLTLLRGAAGFLEASREVTDDEFRAYVRRLRLEAFYPGVLGVGWAAAAPTTAALAAIEAERRRTRFPDFRAWPAGGREIRSTIVYLEPLNRRNRAAIGFDMLSEASRRSAMEASVAAGEARATGRVLLVQEIDAVKQPGFLIYMPVYAGHPQDGSAPGARALRGWIYSPLRTFDLFDAVFAGRDLGGATVEVYDHSLSPDRLLYRTGVPLEGARHQEVRRLEVAGRSWLVRVTSGPGEGRSALVPTIVAGGLLISLLIAALTLQQTRAALRTEREVQQRTAELRAANERLEAEATAREEAEEMVRQMHRMEAVGQLSGGIAHDFNNMLAVVVGNLDLAQRRSGGLERLDDLLANARGGAMRAVELTRRLLAFSRRQPLSPEVLDPGALVRGMSDLLGRTLGEGVALSTAADAAVWPVLADRSQLENALLNLAINARDAMPEGGRMCIGAENRPAAAVEGASEPSSQDMVAILVRDTGHGMGEEVAARAMEPFFTTKEIGKGTGLGLSQVYGFVNQSGGKLTIRSSPGEGTEVEILLPRHRGGPADAPAPCPFAGPPAPANPGEVVLLVEDEDQVRATSAALLREAGYVVRETADAASALRLLEAGEAVDLLFTDVVMPGMGGRELAEAALRLRPGLKILFTSGYTREAEALVAIAPLLPKPFSGAEVARAVRDRLNA